MNLKITLIGIFSFMIFSLNAQNALFQNTQGILGEGSNAYFNSEGYDISQEDIEVMFDEKGIRKLMNKLDIPKGTLVSESPDFPKVKIIEHAVHEGNAATNYVYYLSSHKYGFTRVVCFGTSSGRIPSFEKEFYRAMITHSFPKSIMTSMEIDTIYFAGRQLDLSTICKWMGPRNLQCPNYGQMNWSEFSDSLRASQLIVNQKFINSMNDNMTIQSEKVVNVVFEGQEVTAIHQVVKVHIPQLIMGGSNVLIVYYVLANVRGRYVACVMSQYTDDNGLKNNKLAPLLAEVMELKE